MPKKKKVLTESAIEKTYEIVKGFNIGDERFGIGTNKPNFVSEKDFTPEVFAKLVKHGALVPVETVRDDEVVVFEVKG